MENRFKLRISRMFRGYIGSCAGDSPDVIEKPQPPPKHPYFRLSGHPPPPKNPHFTSICRPNSPETTAKAAADPISPRPKISPPSIPTSPPLNPFYKTPKNPRKNNNKSNMSYPRRNLFTSSSQDSNYYNGTNYSFSEEEEEPENIPFSWKSALSSTPSRRSKRRTRRRRRKSGAAGKEEGSFVVVKRSSDPYSDFRRSMVEMIVEKQIFAAYDLEQLLQCFLRLNSVCYHRVIVEVFIEIYDVLFSHLFD